jgi:ubiquinone/menaquinone biosynthesis C-methylase UbiE
MLSSLDHRRRSEEFMDRPDIEPQFIQKSLRFIRTVNRMLGYTRATISHLDAFSRSWTPGEMITILDVATGSADIPLAISRWARRKNFDVQIVGLDRHALTAGQAYERSRGDSKISIIRGDALGLPFDSGSFDYAITNMFIHHLDEADVVQVMREMDRVARRGIIVADLIRDRRAYAWVSFFTLLANRRLRHDARVSVAQAFSESEMLHLRDQAKVGYTRYSRHFAHRFVLSGQKG